MEQQHRSYSLLIRFRTQLSHSLFYKTPFGGSVFQIGRSFHSTAIGVSSIRWKTISLLLQCYKKLSKAKLSTFVVSSTGAGFVLASKDSIDRQKLGCTLLGTFGASACANTFNQIFEWKKDALMGRTRLRPLPAGNISRVHALVFALTTGIAGVSLLAQTTNKTSASLAAGNILLYAGIYTPLKQVTYLNTWIGAIVGAIPPLIGWSAANEGSLDPGAWVLASLLYFWQIPHFLSLAWTYRVDYANAGFQMLSKFDLTGKRTSRCALRNCIYLLPVGFLTSHFKVTDKWFAYEVSILTLVLALSASSFSQRVSKQHSRSLFRATIFYLPLVLVAMMLHRQQNKVHEYTWNHVRSDITQLTKFRVGRLKDSPYHADLDDIQTDYTEPLSKRIQPSFPPFAPFPFVPVPITVQQSWNLWDGLDEVIREVSNNDLDVA
eukprot:g3382.t1